ncbi:MULTISPECIES: DMT family transporter [Stappiaceae]|jgi:drug/metabolite transporter (DMT)-like permease|uniref:Carboxylate/amino acid/amine transporter n=2 Tax=Hyphomicrobiales TaxID=356 RepID=A0A0M6XZF7_9HYPH|nr:MULTISPECIES: DMT family transporter [Stappiaceae]ERP93801.1 membrane protein [Labrenzia sp. C1B10]ERS05374.1 membrane protein [Labrenzia sp. C1B70]MEC9402464.1 DMT family transporter [Pseudomonadota bacterium]QFT68199.1 Riboflavin transporter [Labrenzia sp. THAF35]MBN8182059.1 DMT family transporter [Roseibium aggregatum]
MDMPTQQPEPSEATGNRLRRKVTSLTENLPSNTIGALWILLAAFLFSIMVTLIKLLGKDLTVFQILVIRQGIMLAIVAPKILSGLPTSLATKRPGLQLTRIVVAATAMLCGFTAVIELPLADATAISFSKTFFLTIFAIWLLGETVGVHRWGATIVGFLGVVLMLRPQGDGLIDPFALLAIAGAACAGLVMIVVRLLTRTDPPVTILTYQAFGVGLIMIIPAILTWQTPTLAQWGILLGIGIVSWAAQMANIQAFRAGEATAIASLDYTRLLYATVFGALVFHQWPRVETLVGAAVIIAASIYTVRREAKRGQKLARASDGRGYNS